MFKGSIVALVTPMYANGDIHYDELHELIEWHLCNYTDGFVILGTTGESATIDADERQHIIVRVVNQVKGRVPVIVGTGTNSTHRTIQLTEQAMKWGADAALIVTPYYNKPTQEGLFQHFRTVAGAVPIPQILYNVPSRTGCDLLPETVSRLSLIPNIVGLKESVSDNARMKQLTSANLELDLLSGDDANALEFMWAGAKGVISVVANVAPKTFHDMCEAALTNDRSVAEHRNRILSSLYRALFIESNPIPTKWILMQMKKISEGIRLPLTPLSPKFYEEVRECCQRAGVPI